jgi:hypothetical protein
MSPEFPGRLSVDNPQMPLKSLPYHPLKTTLAHLETPSKADQQSLRGSKQAREIKVLQKETVMVLKRYNNNHLRVFVPTVLSIA